MCSYTNITAVDTMLHCSYILCTHVVTLVTLYNKVHYLTLVNVLTNMN